MRSALYSCAAAVHVCRHVQEELFGIPFARGVAPNWSAWSIEKEKLVWEMGERGDDLVYRPGRRDRGFYKFNAVRTPDQKPFYQIIGTAGEGGGVGGIWRDYLGLTAGHARKLTVRLSTLELTSESGNWSYSLHAVPYSAATPLTPDQMAGLAPLPDGTQGESAGLVAKFDAQRTTAGKYEECAREIVLAQGVDSIAVWLRFSSDKPGNRVAMDYAKLEDLGAR
jgi:hypothetical protein